MSPAADVHDDQDNEASPLDLNLLNESQLRALKEMKLSFSEDDLETMPFLQDEHYLIHWLKARKFDVSRSCSMLRNHLRYRKALNFDGGLFHEFPNSVNQIMQEYYTRGQFGHSKHGHPIVYFPFGGIDPKGLVHSLRLSDCFRTVLVWQEERRRSCLQASQSVGRLIQQVVYVLDLKGIGSKHLYRTGLEVFQQIAKLVEQHTPEIIYKIYVINAPTLFYAIFKLVKPILDDNTLRKIQVHGSEGWKEGLLEEVDEDQIPVYYGGTAVGKDGDLKCQDRIRYGGEVPQELFFTEEKRRILLPADVKLTDISIPRAQQVHLQLSVNSPGSVLYWYFESKTTSDVGFAVYRDPEEQIGLPPGDGEESLVPPKLQQDTETLEMVFPYFRLLTHVVPEWNRLVIEKPGTYILQFDNSYSWMYSKSIRYFVTVALPDSDLMKALPLN